jgi:hypothetical protein
MSSDHSLNLTIQLQLLSFALCHPYPSLLPYLSFQLRNVKPFFLQLLQIECRYYREMSPELKEDEELAILVVGRGYQELGYAGEGLRGSKEFMAKAVRVYGSVMQFAGEGLRNDEELFLEAIKDGSLNLTYFPDHLKKPKLMLSALKINLLKFIYVPSSLLSDRDFMLSAVSLNGLFLSDAFPFHSDFLMVLSAVRQNPNALQYASAELRNNKQLVMEAVGREGEVVRFAGEELKLDREVVRRTVEGGYRGFRFLVKGFGEWDSEEMKGLLE